MILEAEINLAALQRWISANLPGCSPDPNAYTPKRSAAGIQPHAQWCTRLQAEKFVASCMARSNKPDKVLRFLAQNRIEIATTLLRFQSQDEQSVRISRPVYGHELAIEIMKATAICPGQSSLYLWGKELGIKFSKKREYSPSEATTFAHHCLAKQRQKQEWGRELGLKKRTRAQEKTA